MLQVLILRYSGSPADTTSYVADHVAYLERHHADGVFLFSGQIEPIEDGGVILARGDRMRVERIASDDPFVRHGVATYEIVSVSQGRAHPRLAELLGEPVGPGGEEHGTQYRWKPGEYRRLRADAPDLVGALNGRSLEPVLQRAGTALLQGLGVAYSPRSTDLARQCVFGLRDRDWPGDALLADELARALGEKAEGSDLTPTLVDLEALGEALDSDPAEGEGAFDPMTGDVLPGIVMASGDFEDEDLDETPEVERIEIAPGSQDAYLDMVLFADTVTDLRLRERLQEALNGRGAFRRFKNAIHNVEGDTLSAWTIFSEERALGRARQWLAERGYRPKP